MENFLTILLSSTVISAIISTVLTFFTNKRKDTVENIVKERKIWRDELRIISDEIAKSTNLAELKIAISKLKVRTNPYGMGSGSIFHDSYVWKQIVKLEGCTQISKMGLENSKIIFINLISCLLKFDWERSKREIKGSIQTKFVIMSLIVCFIFYTIKWFWNYNLGNGKIIDYISYCVVYFIFILFSVLVIYLLDKWENSGQLILYLFVGIIGFIVYIICVIYMPNFLPSDVIDWIIFLTPLLTLLYSGEAKFLLYKKNLKFFILATALTVGETKIPNRYKIFFNNNDKLPSGENIVFKD